MAVLGRGKCGSNPSPLPRYEAQWEATPLVFTSPPTSLPQGLPEECLQGGRLPGAPQKQQRALGQLTGLCCSPLPLWRWGRESKGPPHPFRVPWGKKGEGEVPEAVSQRPKQRREPPRRHFRNIPASGMAFLGSLRWEKWWVPSSQAANGYIHFFKVM